MSHFCYTLHENTERQTLFHTLCWLVLSGVDPVTDENECMRNVGEK